MTPAPAPNAIDAHIGGRLRQRREALKVSVGELADRLDVSERQLARLELGLDRISAAKLALICQAVGVPVAYFFRDFGGPPPSRPPLRLVQ